MGTIRLVPLPASTTCDFGRLAELLVEVFHHPVEIAPRLSDVDFAFDPSRDQYASRPILAALLRERSDGVEKILGVTGLDLFVPVLTFVFGEAQLGGHAAVVSCCRLANDFYGMPPDTEILQERLEKEAIHELGHTFGLLHCPDGLCVMRSSTYVEELDLKDVGFCMDCGSRLAHPR